METKEKESLIISVRTEDLISRFKKLIPSIKNYCELHECRVTDEFDVLDEFETEIKNASLSAKKKIRNRINMMEYKMSMKKINTFYGYLKRALHIDNKVRVKPSERHEKIQAARKEWKVAQAMADEALVQYKQIKGDFYKKQLAVKL